MLSIEFAVADDCPLAREVNGRCFATTFRPGNRGLTRLTEVPVVQLRRAK